MSIKKNFIYNLSYQILIIILPIVTTPYISRIIGPEGVGIQSYTFSIVNYFVLFAMLGINNHGNRSIAMVRNNKEKLNKTFMSIYLVQAIMAIIMIMFYLLYVIFIASKYRIMLIIQLIYIISALLDINWFFFGLEKFKITVVRNTVIKLLSVCSIFLFVKESNDLYLYSMILALGTLISQIVLWRYIRDYVKFTKVTKEEIIQEIKPILILFIPVVSISIYKIMDKIMLGAMTTVTQVGFYENSEKIINIPMGMITALGAVMLPKMSNLYATGNVNESKRYMEISIELVMFMSIGSMFGLVGVSPILIPIFLGEKFTQCVDVVSLLSITLLFLSWANVIRTQYLIPKKRDKVYIGSTILGAVINVIVNLLLISKLGAVGAAIGTIFAEASVAIYQTIMVRKELCITEFFKKTIFYLIPGLIMCILTRYIGQQMEESIITGLVQIVVGGFVYCIISLVYMVIIKNDIVVNIINKFNNKINYLE